LKKFDNILYYYIILYNNLMAIKRLVSEYQQYLKDPNPFYSI